MAVMSILLKSELVSYIGNTPATQPRVDAKHLSNNARKSKRVRHKPQNRLCARALHGIFRSSDGGNHDENKLAEWHRLARGGRNRGERHRPAAARRRRNDLLDVGSDWGQLLVTVPSQR
jgi:hypothetical protein